MIRIPGKLNKAIILFCLIICLGFTMTPVREVRATSASELDPPLDTVLTNVKNYMLSVDTNPDYSSIWNVIGMVRSGQSIPDSYIDTFYNNTVNYLEENNWQLSRTKYSDYSKLIIGMTAIGKDARDIDGHNILGYLSDFSKVKLQGFNGPIWALIALNSHPDYEIPLDVGAAEQTTEEGLIEYLLGRETSKGGWTLYGDTPDTDITGMTIQALAPYYGSREDVSQAVDRALAWLSSAQNSQGGYSTLNGSTSTETSESDAQVIVALCSLGIDPATDSRFIQENGKGVLSRLFEYYISAGEDKAGFMHVFADSDNNGGGAAGTLNGMATEQGMYAVAAYKRLLTGKTALYDMSDIEISPGEAVDPSASDATTATTEKKSSATESSATTQTSTTTKKVKVKAVYLDYKQISLQKGKTRTLKLTLSPTNATNKKVRWTTSNKKIATVTQKGKVKGIKAGTATITVTARDGSKKKASCKVIVYNPYSGTTSSSSGTTASSSSTSYSNQTNTVQRNPSVNYYTNGSSGQTSGQSVGQTSGNTAAAANGAAEASTQAGAWTFDGESYVADSSGDSLNTDTDIDEGQEDFEEEMDEDSEEDLDEDNSSNQNPESKLPAWLSILLGFFSSGGIASGFKVPWQKLRGR